MTGIDPQTLTYQVGDFAIDKKKDHFFFYNDAFRHFIYSYTEETCFCHFMSCSSQLAVKGLLYAPSHRQDSTFRSLY